MHSRVLAIGACVLALLVAASTLAVTTLPFGGEPAGAQVWESPTDPDDLLDQDLLAALRHLGLADWWVEESGLDRSVAFLAIDGSTLTEPLRDELIRLAQTVIKDQAELAVAGLKIRSAEIVHGDIENNLDSISSRRVEVAARRDTQRGEEASLSEMLDRTQVSAAETVASVSAIEAALDRGEKLAAQLDETTSDRESVEQVLSRLDAAATTLGAEVGDIAATVEAHRTKIADLVEQRGDLREYARVVATKLIDLRASRNVSAVGLRLVVLGAYVNGAAWGGSCGLDWALLGGIGWVESHHGTYRGATVQPDGRLSQPLLGIRLDGSNSAVILDTDGGRLDGDVSYDRAVGPMQFIPSTWARHSTDGNSDGIADPQNLADAAATAGQYLCRVGGPNASLRTRILGYNNSNKYVDDVLRAAAGLRSTELPHVP